MKDLLTIKTGELIAKIEELRDINESLHLLNNEVRIKTEVIKKTKKDLTEIERNLFVANDKLTETNEKFALTNKELAIVNKELVVANEQIKQLVLKQKEFIDITAHELRSPIQAISGNFELIEILHIPSLLKNSLTKQDNINNEFESLVKDKHRLEQFTKGLVSTYRNSLRLEKLVNDILDVSRIENNRLPLHKEFFNLNEKILNVIKDISNKTKNHNNNNNNNNLITDNLSNHIDIVFEPSEDPIIVFADKIQIFQVLSNLINNATKFSNGKSIVISVKKVQKNIPSINGISDNNIEVIRNGSKKNTDEMVIVSIKDKGKGIDEKILPILFTKFTTTSTQGTGLGLFISKNIIETHGGQIWAQNNEDRKGATFSFSLPLNN